MEELSFEIVGVVTVLSLFLFLQLMVSLPTVSCLQSVVSVRPICLHSSTMPPLNSVRSLCTEVVEGTRTGSRPKRAVWSLVVNKLREKNTTNTCRCI